MKDKLIKRIQNLLALGNTNKNTSDAEAKEALLKAHELMAKHNLSNEEVSGAITDEIAVLEVKSVGSKKYRIPLANVLAPNFRCKAAFGNDLVVFVGHSSDAAIVSEVFQFVYSHLLYRTLKEKALAKQNTGTFKDIETSFAYGFIKGIELSLTEQSKALMVIVPKDVNDKFDEITTQGKPISMGNSKINRAAYTAGLQEGKEILAKRRLQE